MNLQLKDSLLGDVNINKVTFVTTDGKTIKSKFTLDQLWEHNNIASKYVEGTDSKHLIGKDYISWGRNGKMLYHVLKLVPIASIKDSTESLKKMPVYKDKITQAPPIDVSLIGNGKYKLHNGHRRYASAKARGDKTIFAEITYIGKIVQM